MRCVLTASRAIERDSSSETSSVARMARPTAVPATTTARSSSAPGGGRELLDRHRRGDAKGRP